MIVHPQGTEKKSKEIFISTIGFVRRTGKAKGNVFSMPHQLFS